MESVYRGQERNQRATANKGTVQSKRTKRTFLLHVNVLKIKPKFSAEYPISGCSLFIQRQTKDQEIIVCMNSLIDREEMLEAFRKLPHDTVVSISQDQEMSDLR